MDCIFCKIIDGEVPAYRIFENDNVVAFLDIDPKSFGHTLVVPKKHTRNMLYTTDEISISDLNEIAKLMQDKLGCDGINIISNNEAVAGQEVFHTHFHLVPQYIDQQINDRKYEYNEIVGMLTC